MKKNTTKKPFNLLFEVFLLGAQMGVMSTAIKVNKEKFLDNIEKELDDLAKKFGFPGLEHFDKKHFDNTEKSCANCEEYYAPNPKCNDSPECIGLSKWRMRESALKS